VLYFAAPQNVSERARVAASLSRPIAAAREIFNVTNECRRFVSAEAIATLKGWGRHEQNPQKFYLKLEPGALAIGRAEEDAKWMKFGNAFFNVLGKLPNIGKLSDVT
jgi:hypothetical protein